MVLAGFLLLLKFKSYDEEKENFKAIREPLYNSLPQIKGNNNVYFLLSNGIHLDDEEEIDSLIEDYFRKNITFKVHGEIVDFDFLGKVYKSDVLIAYMELQLDTIAPPLSIENTIFFDYLPDQKNIIHLKLASKRKSFLAVSSKSVFEIPNDFFNMNN